MMTTKTATDDNDGGVSLMIMEEDSNHHDHDKNIIETSNNDKDNTMKSTTIDNCESKNNIDNDTTTVAAATTSTVTTNTSLDSSNTTASLSSSHSTTKSISTQQMTSAITTSAATRDTIIMTDNDAANANSSIKRPFSSLYEKEVDDHHNHKDSNNLITIPTQQQQTLQQEKSLPLSPAQVEKMHQPPTQEQKLSQQQQQAQAQPIPPPQSASSLIIPQQDSPKRLKERCSKSVTTSKNNSSYLSFIVPSKSSTKSSSSSAASSSNIELSSSSLPPSQPSVDDNQTQNHSTNNNDIIEQDNNNNNNNNKECDCDGCTRPRCFHCSICDQFGFLYNMCVLKACHKYRNNDDEIRNLHEIHEILKDGENCKTQKQRNNNIRMKSSNALAKAYVVGQRVYAAWNEKNMKSGWYWGHITAKYMSTNTTNNTSSRNSGRSRSGRQTTNTYRSHNAIKRELYTVTFDDGDKKECMEREDIWSEFKYHLFREKLRLEEIVKSTPKKGNKDDNDNDNKHEDTKSNISTDTKLDIISENHKISVQQDQQHPASSAQMTTRTGKILSNPIEIIKPITTNRSEEIEKEHTTANDQSNKESIIASTDNGDINLTVDSVDDGTASTAVVTSSSASLSIRTPDSALTMNDDAKNNEAMVVTTNNDIDNPEMIESSSSKTISVPNFDNVYEWWKRGCDHCTNCRREKCQKCFMCLKSSSVTTLTICSDATTTTSDENNHNVNIVEGSNNNIDKEENKWNQFQCYHKMCLKISEEEKLQVAPSFPSGWKFGFIKPARNKNELKGLILAVLPSKHRIRFRTVEGAVSYINNSLASNHKSKNISTNASIENSSIDDSVPFTIDIQHFYDHVGLADVLDKDETNPTKDVTDSTIKVDDHRNLYYYQDDDISSMNDGKRKFYRSHSGRLIEHVYSTQKKVGARVYAKFTNDEWYWGTITKVISGSSEKGYPKYSILYEDGEAVHHVADDFVVNEKEYFEISKMAPPTPPLPTVDKDYDSASECYFPPMCERVSFTLVELFQLRCNECPSCLRRNCNKCLSCHNNKLSTTRDPQVCYFNMCETIPNSEKAQPVPGLPDGWNFFISSNSAGRLSNSHNKLKNARIVHSDLAGLHIVAPDGKNVYRTIEEALKTFKVRGEETKSKAKLFYETYLGIRPRRDVPNHPLVRHGFHREWFDGNGRYREVYGQIIACWETTYANDSVPDLHFSVRYEKATRDVINSTSLCNLSIPEVDDNVQDHIAWGGFLSFTKRIKMTAVDQMVARNAPFHFSWVVPGMRYSQHSDNSEYPSIVMITRGYKLEFEAKPSSIPNSGLGLWVKCTVASKLIANDATSFELNPGEGVDLGCYAPTDNRDRRSEHVNLVKTFVNNWECESWLFEMGSHDKQSDIFDITDDLTGDLHEVAKKNILVYANETDGKETATVFAEHDPEGSVHYYMGHRDGKIFSLPATGKSIELKVDYGPKYENVRVRKGYTRLSEKDADIVRETLQAEDSDMLAEIHEFSAKDIFDVISFLEKLMDLSSISVNKTMSSGLGPEKLVRALIVAMSLHKRVSNILKEFARPTSSSPKNYINTNNSNHEAIARTTNFCDNGFTDMKNKKAFERSRKLVGTIISQFDHPDTLKNAICSYPLYRTIMQEVVYYNSSGSAAVNDKQTSIETLSSEQLQKDILQKYEYKA